ncbi:unnamed protein product [Trifolium pratense]|uniref:Uncharacterized protein n=1 Tax=Trifolium pratense TaxID=57577 RepID=A0ACB0JMX1_TRIPR|nr:unnamed protein product [Trifolium pratense]
MLSCCAWLLACCAWLLVVMLVLVPCLCAWLFSMLFVLRICGKYMCCHVVMNRCMFVALVYVGTYAHANIVGI